jgi:hypothetical protein
LRIRIDGCAAICPKARARKFAGHSLRAGLASSAEVDQRYVQQQLGSIGRTGSADAAMILFNSLVEVLALA